MICAEDIVEARPKLQGNLPGEVLAKIAGKVMMNGAGIRLGRKCIYIYIIYIYIFFFFKFIYAFLFGKEKRIRGYVSLLEGRKSKDDIRVVPKK